MPDSYARAIAIPARAVPASVATMAPLTVAGGGSSWNYILYYMYILLHPSPLKSS